MDRKHILWSSQNENNILYKNLKNNEIMADVRKYFENLYDNLNSHGLKDKHFDKDFPNNVPGRWFELYIGNYLLNQNLKNLVANCSGSQTSEGWDRDQRQFGLKLNANTKLFKLTLNANELIRKALGIAIINFDSL